MTPAQASRLINERVEIENILFNMSSGDLALPNAEDCKMLARMLGVPKEHWTSKMKNHKWRKGQNA